MQINFQGKMVEATELDFFTRKEDFNEYQLSDGKILKIKWVVTSIVKISNEKNPDGSPIYKFQTTVVAKVT